jgi:hypothetical protein
LYTGTVSVPAVIVPLGPNGTILAAIRRSVEGEIPSASATSARR